MYRAWNDRLRLVGWVTIWRTKQIYKTQINFLTRNSRQFIHRRFTNSTVSHCLRYFNCSLLRMYWKLFLESIDWILKIAKTWGRHENSLPLQFNDDSCIVALDLTWKCQMMSLFYDSILKCFAMFSGNNFADDEYMFVFPLKVKRSDCPMISWR